MTNIWVIADTHFGHRNILTFRRKDGTLIRGALWNSIEDHDRSLIQNWNNVVAPQDHVYHLGDVVINKKSLGIVRELNGHKRLCLGNHDIFPVEAYLAAGFEKVYGVRVWPGHNLIFSHIPLHPDSLRQRSWKNIHGHLHDNVVYSDGTPDASYECVSVERIAYQPKLIMR